ncbi:SDR family oxidoreductase [Rhizobium glycinendophyticum]|uniref:SDR family NAD(P)-dependent oxidoreductase n=1 Tax=Rhizobium glycinendophyticum TaxID=2589807 RepID=A0A504U5P9_9HYPH|nr:SDR family oxidoreductase [Rhizobium glycinendophyticum]TPP10334.1 SDR family NAD(P)-dependent oxidoreductase [Rhizobium glycinendophyticum]
MQMTDNTILITGGGSGIGAALAHRFHDLGNTVIIAGRRLDALQATIGDRPNMHALALDIEDPAAIIAFAETLVSRFPDINVLINNAGIMRFETLDRSRDLTDAEATVTTNLLGPIRLIDALVEHLAARPNAAIVNVSSGLAFVPLVATPTYSATKAAIHSYTQSLRDALSGKIEVIELAPPAVQTELTPGQSSREGYLPLKDFIDEVMALFAKHPTPAEILVQRVRFQRDAEAENRFEQTFAAINEFARKAREGK